MKKNILFIANWKMNLSNKQAIELARGIAPTAKKYARTVTTIVAPSFLALGDVMSYISRHTASMQMCAQNCFWEQRGAYTGEVSPDMLAESGCEYVLIGHSERRIYCKETNEMIQKKLACVFGIKKCLTPVLCIGETLEEKKKGTSEQVLKMQLRTALQGISLKKNQKLIIAYEPVWAIGTGTPMTADEFGICVSLIRDLAHVHCSILYGGSVTPQTASAYVYAGGDGVLVGGASQCIDSCKALIQTLNTAYRTV